MVAPGSEDMTIKEARITYTPAPQVVFPTPTNFFGLVMELDWYIELVMKFYLCIE